VFGCSKRSGNEPAFTAAFISARQIEANFPRNAPQNFTKYLSERPEMPSRNEQARQANNKKRKLKS
jgi:hypothetical protein